MADMILASDADGCVVLTTEQSIALARYWTARGPDVDDALCALSGFEALDEVVECEDASLDVLARWVLRWAPVVEAAEHAYDAAADPTTGGAGTAGGYQSAMDAVADIYDAVREARAKKAKVPA